jgi:hypothetical protein
VRSKLTSPAAMPALALLALVVALSACGSSSSGDAASRATAPGAHAAKPTPRGCAARVATTLGEVAARIYAAASHGSNVGEAVGRVRASSALRNAISSGDTPAIGNALDALLVNQIARIEIVKGGHVIATAGDGAAIAPVHGSIPETDAGFVLSVQAASSYLQVTQQVTGAQILLDTPSKRLAGTTAGPPLASVRHDGALHYGGHSYAVTSVAAATYPSGSLRIVLLVPTARLSCPGSAAQTHVETLGHVGERIYQEEAGSPYVKATLRHLEADPGFQRAVAARDTAATRAAIVGFFAAHIHVVRVRVNVSEPSGAQRFFFDLGGPYVLAPVHGTLRSGGRVVGHFSFAIQDDAGYLRLARLFTGAEVLMRTGAKQVIGSLDPGPSKVPDRGTVSYRGRDYEAYSFSGVAFPSGPLRISLLIAR